MLTLVFKCWPDPIPPTYRCRQPKAREWPVLLITSRADFRLESQHNIKCQIIKHTLYVYIKTKISVNSKNTWFTGQFTSKDNDWHSPIRKLIWPWQLIYLSDLPVKAVLCHVSDEATVSNHLCYSTQSFPGRTPQDWIGAAQGTLKSHDFSCSKYFFFSISHIFKLYRINILTIIKLKADFFTSSGPRLSLASAKF